MSTKNLVPATNGAGQKPTNGNSQKPELSNLHVSVDTNSGEIKNQDEGKTQLPSIEARLKRLGELQELQDKREVIVDALENLNKFYIAPSGAGCNLKLTDSKSNTFAIVHPSVIGEIVAMSKGKLQDELLRIESEMTFTL